MYSTYFRKYMQVLLYLVEMERLHISQTPAAFNKCNKEGLVRSIWRNHRHEQRVGTTQNIYAFLKAVLIVCTSANVL